MTKSQAAILTVLTVILTLFVAFLSWRVSNLASDVGRLGAVNEGGIMDAHRVAENVEKLSAELAAHGKKITELEGTAGTLPDAIMARVRSLFLPLPEYAPRETLFRSENLPGGGMRVTGDLDAIARWEERNRFYLEDTLREGLEAAFDPASRGLAVRSMAPGSPFAQIGIRPGDVIAELDGVTPTTADDLGYRLLDHSPFRLEIRRGPQRLVVEVGFVPGDPHRRGLAYTRSEFNTLAPQGFLSSAGIEPAGEPGREGGARVTDIAPGGIFGMIGVRDGDIVTAVDGQPVTAATFAESLAAGPENSLIISIEREGKPHELRIGFVPDLQPKSDSE